MFLKVYNTAPKFYVIYVLVMFLENPSSFLNYLYHLN
jgi:hypothetical protein